MTTDNLEKCHPCARAAGTVPNCPASGLRFLDHADAGYCPLAVPRFGTGAKPAGWDELPKAEHRSAAAVIDDRLARYHAAWHRLHTEGVGKDAAWLEGWLRADVPCGECRAKARKILADRPPTFPLQAVWTFEFHNDINAALGKPLAAFADVAPLYAWPTH